MKQYKDIINFSIINKLKQRISDACIIFNNLVRKENINRRESEFYEVYTKQYQQDMQNLRELRDRCLHVADECNKIMLNMNIYHIKQYYLDKEELSEYEGFDDYNEQISKPTETPTQKPIEKQTKKKTKKKLVTIDNKNVIIEQEVDDEQPQTSNTIVDDEDEW